MNSAQKAALFRKREKETKDGLKKLMEEPLDWTKYKWDIDIERAESQADMKLLADSLSDLSNKDEEMKDIIDNVSKNIETRKQCEEEEEALNEEKQRSAERLRRFKEILEKIENDKFQTNIKINTVDEIDNMSTEQLDDKLKELCKAMEDLRVAREGPGCIPEVRESLEKYQKLIKGALNIIPRRPDNLKLYSSVPKRKSVRDLLLHTAKELKVNEQLVDKLEKIPRDDGVQAEFALDYIKEMAKDKKIPDHELPTFIKSILMPDFV